jgi:hypothetical protein
MEFESVRVQKVRTELQAEIDLVAPRLGLGAKDETPEKEGVTACVSA